MKETQVQSLGQEDPLEKEIATHSSILAWKIPWMEEPGGPPYMGSQRVGPDWATNTQYARLWTEMIGTLKNTQEELITQRWKEVQTIRRKYQQVNTIYNVQRKKTHENLHNMVNY